MLRVLGLLSGLAYRWLARPALFLLPAESAHHVAFGALRLVMAVPGMKRLCRRALLPPSAERATTALGLRFPSPVGLAAGFDKDARGPDALLALGFGFVEVGTLTARAQPGNPRPRLFRLPADRALINRMGFNNGGAAAAAARLARRDRSAGIVGVNIGKTKVVEEAYAAADYVESARLLAPHADYLVVNVSSPNTPGLRALQATEKLRPLLSAVQAAAGATPLLVKLAPDLTDEELDALADLALELGLAGIVATNTTTGREGLSTPADEVAALGAGGLSGAPLRARSLEVVRRLSARTQGRLVIIAAGGIASSADVEAQLAAGATLVQVYTAFIYEGPLLPSNLARGLPAPGEQPDA